MAKKKLTREQNELLGKTEDLSKKFSLLEEWLKAEEISETLYNGTINKLINRAMKAAKPSLDLGDKTAPVHKLAIEAEIQELIDRLRTNLNLYLSERNKTKAKISPADIESFKKYINVYPQLKSKVNRLLIVGLRYPDETLNKIAEDYIKQHRLSEKINRADIGFWLLLWEDGNFVPLNAIRLMLVENEDGYKLNPCFSTTLISELVPMIEFQRDKELLRLEWAKSLSNPIKRQHEVERKQKRLNAFNCLLKVAKR